MKKELIVKWKVKESALPEVMDLLPSLTAKSKAEAGNIFYTIYQSDSDPTELILHECYESEEALKAHKSADHYQELVVGKIIPQLIKREVSIVSKLF